MEKVFYILEKLYRMTYIPVRYFDQTGKIRLLSFGYESDCDPLICDTILYKNIVDKVIPDSLPILFFEDECIYGAFSDSSYCTIILGPVSLKKFDEFSLKQYTHIHQITSQTFYIKQRKLDELCAALSVIYFTLTGIYASEMDISTNRMDTEYIQKLQENTVQNYFFDYTDQEYQRFNFSREMDFISYIREGDSDGIRKEITVTSPSFYDESRVGRLANKSFKHNEYLAVSIIVLASRAAIDGGLNVLTSYLISDLYLQRLEGCKDITEIFRIIQDVAIEYAERVKQKKQNRSEMAYIEQCKNFIASHLNKSFSLEDIANEIGINKSYLSRRFSESEGLGIQQYTLKKRIEAACNMLKYSNENIMAISSYLCFTSQSHFGKVFKDHMGITPQKYRNSNKHTDFK